LQQTGLLVEISNSRRHMRWFIQLASLEHIPSRSHVFFFAVLQFLLTERFYFHLRKNIRSTFIFQYTGRCAKFLYFVKILMHHLNRRYNQMRVAVLYRVSSVLHVESTQEANGARQLILFTFVLFWISGRYVKNPCVGLVDSNCIACAA
jgi:hypothetical protein